MSTCRLISSSWPPSLEEGLSCPFYRWESWGLEHSVKPLSSDFSKSCVTLHWVLWGPWKEGPEWWETCQHAPFWRKAIWGERNLGSNLASSVLHGYEQVTEPLWASVSFPIVGIIIMCVYIYIYTVDCSWIPYLQLCLLAKIYLKPANQYSQCLFAVICGHVQSDEKLELPNVCFPAGAFFFWLIL